MYKNSIANIFLSPLHYVKVSKMLDIQDRPYFILRPTVDTGKFYNMNQERDIEYIFAGAISEAKGVGNLKKYFENTDKKLLMIGKNIYGEELSFAEYTGFIPYDEMPKYFNRAKNFIYLPRWPEPQGRVVVEAALCGCTLITNENVGATSFDFDISNKENLRDAVKEFWDYIENLNR
jgi:glycosyltransferase involved in cell wall biosynthesis